MKKLNSRERVERAIHFEAPDRVPFNFWMDRRRMAGFEAQYGPDFRINHYDADMIVTGLPIQFPTGHWQQGMGTAWLVEPLFDDFSEANRLPMPNPADPTIYEELEHNLKLYPDRAVEPYLPNVLTVVEGMIPQQALYLNMLTDPDGVQSFFSRLSDVMVAVAKQVCKMDITVFNVADDVGCNKGLLVSPALFREFILPHWKKVIDVAHACGKPVSFHTDGKVDEIWAIFADELGVCMLNPLQPNLQDLDSFKKLYHGRMGIYGGLDTARIHQMSPDQIRRHVRDLFERTGSGGGLIVSTHDIDYSVTEEQIDALVTAIKSCAY